MAALYAAGVRGSTLTAITAWKEILLAVALARVGRDAVRERRLPFRFGVADGLALAFAVVVPRLRRRAAVGARRPRRTEGGRCSRCATTSFPWPRTSSAARSGSAAPTSAGSRGRCSARPASSRRSGSSTSTSIPIGWWRTNGVVDYFHKHLGYDYHGTGENPRVAGLPENFIFNVGGGQAVPAPARLDVPQPAREQLPVRRRARRRRGADAAAAHGRDRARRRRGRRAALDVLALVAARASRSGSSCSRSVQRRPRLVAARGGRRRGGGRLGASLPADRADRELDEGGSRLPARGRRGASRARRARATSASESSLLEHWRSLKDGIHTVIHHPQGFGLGNVGQTASRTGTPLKAGESNYTELGAEVGVLGAALFDRVVRRAARRARPCRPVGSVGGGARGRVRGDARARDPDGRDRRSVGRVLRLAARRRARRRRIGSSGRGRMSVLRALSPAAYRCPV